MQHTGISLEHPTVSPHHQPVFLAGPKHLPKAHDLFQGAFRHLPGEDKHLPIESQNLRWEHKHLPGAPSTAPKHLPGAPKHLPGRERHQCWYPRISTGHLPGEAMQLLTALRHLTGAPKHLLRAPKNLPKCSNVSPELPRKFFEYLSISDVSACQCTVGKGLGGPRCP